MLELDVMNLTIDLQMQQSRQTAFPVSIGGLQRQSSGSSYGESSISDDYFLLSLLAAVNRGGGDPDAYAHLPDGGGVEVSGSSTTAEALSIRLWVCVCALSFTMLIFIDYHKFNGVVVYKKTTFLAILLSTFD